MLVLSIIFRSGEEIGKPFGSTAEGEQDRQTCTDTQQGPVNISIRSAVLVHRKCRALELKLVTDSGFEALRLFSLHNVSYAFCSTGLMHAELRNSKSGIINLSATVRFLIQLAKQHICAILGGKSKLDDICICFAPHCGQDHINSHKATLL